MTDIKEKQTVTIKKGKNAGQAGEVTAVSAGQVSLKMADGTLVVVNETNVKAPEVPTIAADRLAEVIDNLSKTVSSQEARDTLWALAGDLERDLPGIQAEVMQVHEV